MTPPPLTPIYGFTAKANGISRVLQSLVKVAQAFDPQKGSRPPLKEYGGIWDTGATNSVITEKVVNECELKPIGIVKVFHGGGEDLRNVFLVNIVLPNRVGISNLRVTQGNITGGCDVLIGMDVMSKGDFVLSNFEGKTWFSFRIPSAGNIDLADQNFSGSTSSPATSTTNPYSKVGRNAPCPCGSGKKYKRCHGKGTL
jgi:hypothetical protein